MIGNQGTNNRKLISLHNNGKDNKHAHGFAGMFIVLAIVVETD
jgi:hypothetical protein